ncbi:DUF4184 family protein [Lacisediminihabitans changchengi]|uniref:DUF4184 family protein n=1 Tax=Lacisediminihabitans changchengi TaxID=2787634 RepID=A0A934SJ60_9MICO|nr:DUF4184 family protein [Lacisediminihabitans changchengi]MBK4347616.1 DUF4184 family protein [Lacisediminihabitans changchengi]
MPFTPSHIAAILPVVRTPLLPASLAIGSMVPDLPYFVPLPVEREFSHSLPGVPLVDLPMGIASVLLWVLVFRAPLLDFAPAWLRRRFVMPKPWQRTTRALVTGALLVLLSLTVGIATHLIWDALTHPDGWVVLHAAVLREQYGPFAGYRWAQYGSSVVGLLVVAVWAVVWVRRTPLHALPLSRLRRSWRVVAWVAVAGVLTVIALLIWIAGLAGGSELLDRVVVYHVATRSIAAAGVLAVLLCLGWYLLPRGRGRDGQTERSTATTLPNTWA